MRTTASLILGMTLCALIAACGSGPPPPPPPREASIELRGYSDMNPNLDGQPNPLLVQIVQLKGSSEWNTATFDRMIGDPAAALPTTFVSPMPARQTIQVGSPSSTVVPMKLNDATTHIGIFGFFTKQPEGTDERLAIITAEQAVAGVALKISGTSIRIDQ